MIIGKFIQKYSVRNIISNIRNSHFSTAKLHYIVENSPDKSINLNLLVVHGLLGSSNNFKSVLHNPKISKKVNSIMVDLRNHGNSEHKDSMSIEDMAHDLAQFIKDQNLKNLIIMGHSLGGRVSMKTCLHYPELIKGAIIIDIMPVNYYDEKHKYTFAEGMERLLIFLSNMDLNRSLTQIKKSILEIEPNEAVVDFIMTNLVPLGLDKFKWRCNMAGIASNYTVNIKL